MTDAKLKREVMDQKHQCLDVDLVRFRSQSEMSVNTVLAKLTRVCSYNIQVGLWGAN
jgi:hypothetical protein